MLTNEGRPDPQTSFENATAHEGRNVNGCAAHEIFGMLQSPILDLVNLPEQRNVWTTYSVLNDTANLIAVAEISNIGTRSDTP